MIADAVSTVVRNRDRVAAVRRVVPLYQPPSVTFDRITRLAAELLATPIAVLTLVDADRQFFVSSHGLGEPLRSARQTPLDYSICQHAVATGRPLVVPNTSAQPELSGNLAVVELGIAAYAGVPLITAERHALGALGVADLIGREWTDHHLCCLADLAAIATDSIRLAGLERHVALERGCWPARSGRFGL